MALFGKDSASLSNTEIPGMDLKQDKYVEISTTAMYERILYAVIKEIQGTEENVNKLTLSASDNYSPFARGFVHFVANAMAHKKQVFIKKEKAGKRFIFVKSSSSEYDSDSINVIELDFKKFEQATIIKEIFIMLYDALNGASKGVKISQGLLVMVSKLSEMMADKRQITAVEEQISNISNALRDASTAYVDAGSDAKFISFDTEPTEKQIQFCLSMLSNTTGFSLSFFNGMGGSSMSDTGESDKKQNRTAIEFYFLSVVQSVLEAIFKETYKLKPVLDSIELLPSLMATIEMWGEGSEKGKEFLYEQIGLNKEHLDLSKEVPPVVPVNPVTDKNQG